MILKYKTKRKTKGNVCFLFVECIASCGKLTRNYSPVEKLYCTTGKTATFKFTPKTKQVRAEEISTGECGGDLVEQSRTAMFCRLYTGHRWRNN